jgi:antitoxin component of MazEF toxin-antitoxin module
MLAKPLTKIGNSQGILLDKQILALVGATSPDTVFKITVEGEDKIILKVMSAEEKDRLVLEAAEEQMRVHSKTFEKLAK